MEQRRLKLTWYKIFEYLVKLDELYNSDHVTAFVTKNSSANGTSVTFNYNKIVYPPASRDLLAGLSKYQKAKPVPSRQFRAGNIYKRLIDHFKDCWEHDKSNSPKLSFYNSSKTTFKRETYLEITSNSAHRHKMTRLRISAHNLEIEQGRYRNIPREDRICKWCLLTMGSRTVEDEAHVLYSCDLYSDVRNKLINTLKRAPSNNQNIALNIINTSSINRSFMKLLSPCTTGDNDDYLTQHHTPPNSNRFSPEFKQYEQLRSYINNCLCAFVDRCLDKHQKFHSEMKLKSTATIAMTNVR